MACGAALFASFDEDNELQKLIEEHQVGIFTKANNHNELSIAILELFNQRDLCKEYGKNGRKYNIENRSRKIGTQKLIYVFLKDQKAS